MSSSDEQRWDARYSDATPPASLHPSELLTTTFHDLPVNARVLDVACGWGDAGLWLAERGAKVTLTDVSGVALDAVARRAADRGLDVTTIIADLTSAAIPAGPWDLITCVHYLDRDLLPRLADAISPSGQLAVAIATTTNLERHKRPSARFLVERGELPTLVPSLDVVGFSEAWRRNDAHEAWLVARAQG